jgi:hypothetical protein
MQITNKVRLLMVQTFIYSTVMYGAEVWERRRRSRQDIGGRKESSPQHSSPASRDCSSDVLYGDTGLLPPVVLVDAAKLCWQHRSKNMEAGRWPRRRCDSHSRVAVVSGQPKVKHGLVR